MTDDSTLGGYLDKHQRPPAFESSDGAAYSASLYVDDAPTQDGRYGAAILFVRWSDAGDRPVGHVETPFVAFGRTPEEAGAELKKLTLHQVKTLLDQAVESWQTRPSW